MPEHLQAIGMRGRYAVQDIPCEVCGGTEFVVLRSRGRVGEAGVYGDLPVAGCHRCGYVMVNPRYEARFYEEYYRSAYRKVATGDTRPTPEYIERQRYRGRRILDSLRRWAPKPGRMLDLGCSVGATMMPFQEAGWDAVGIDPDTGCVEYGRVELGLPVQLGEAETLDLPDRHVDLVVSLGSLEHVHDLGAALRSCRRVVRDGGLLFMRYRSRTMWGSPLEYFNHNHYRYFSERTLRLLMERYGFSPLAFIEEPLEGIPGAEYLVTQAAEPGGLDAVIRAVESGVRDDAEGFRRELQAYEATFAERSRRFLEFVAVHGGDHEAIAGGVRAGRVDYVILDGPLDEAVERAVMEAELFLAEWERLRSKAQAR